MENQLTIDGTEHLINGKFDWVYKEEFEISDSWAWSPDGSSIAYWQLDESHVLEYYIIDFMTKRSKVETICYPNAGDTNSIIRIGIVSLKTKKTVWMDFVRRRIFTFYVYCGSWIVRDCLSSG